MVYWDDGVPGFGLKVTPHGRKVFIVLYRTKDGLSRLRKYTIGTYGQTTLAIARIAAQKVLADRNEGKDPAREKRDLRKKVVTDTVEDVVKEYRSRHVDALRSAYEINRIIDTEILSRWKTKSIHEIGRRDILSALDEIVARGSPAAANYTFTVMRAMFNWAIGRGILEKSPCTGLSKPTPSNRGTGYSRMMNSGRSFSRRAEPVGHMAQLLSFWHSWANGGVKWQK